MTTDDVLTIKSAAESLRLEVGPAVLDAYHADYPACLVGGPGRPSGTVDVSDLRGSPDISDFLQDLADNWRGWDGPKSWESAEGHLRLEATTDALGHIFMKVTLR